MTVPARRPAAPTPARPTPAPAAPPVVRLTDEQFSQLIATIHETGEAYARQSAQQQRQAEETRRVAEAAELAKLPTAQLSSRLFESLRVANNLRSPGWTPPNFFN